jgi:hypothetical protein
MGSDIFVDDTFFVFFLVTILDLSRAGWIQTFAASICGCPITDSR